MELPRQVTFPLNEVAHDRDVSNWISGKIPFNVLPLNYSEGEHFHTRVAKGIFSDEPRYIISKIPSLTLTELEDSREYCNCCGCGGDLLVSNQDLSLDIAKLKVNEVLNTGVRTVVTACPSCVRAITMAKTAEKAQLEVLDIAQLVWKVMAR